MASSTTDIQRFQSTPVIADERMGGQSCSPSPTSTFQSTPVIADERMECGYADPLPIEPVSIHARHC